MWSVVITCLVGLVIGVAGKAIILRGNSGGMITAVVLAITGAMFVGMMGWLMDWFPAGSVTGLLASAVGAALAVNIFRWSDANPSAH